MKVLCKHNEFKKILKSNIFNNNKCVCFLETGFKFDMKGKLQLSFLPVVMYIQVKHLLERDLKNNNQYIERRTGLFSFLLGDKNWTWTKTVSC